MSTPLALTHTETRAGMVEWRIGPPRTPPVESEGGAVWRKSRAESRPSGV